MTVYLSVPRRAGLDVGAPIRPLPAARIFSIDWRAVAGNRIYTNLLTRRLLVLDLVAMAKRRGFGSLCWEGQNQQVIPAGILVSVLTW